VIQSKLSATQKPHARRTEVVVPDFLVGSPAHDYADAFEVDLPAAEIRSPEQLFRAALDNASWLQRWVPVVHRHMLQFRLGTRVTSDHILGWRIVRSDPEVLHLEASGKLIRGVIVGRRTTESRGIFTTFVYYVRRVPAHIVWAVAAPLHRRIAPYLLERGVMTGSDPRP